MSDQDFNFKPPPPRREANKAFEPPPWEKDQFDELARRKEAERVTAEALAGAATQPAPAEPLPQAAPQPDVPVPAQAPPAEAERSQDAGENREAEEDPRIQTMLLGLKAEEEPFGRDIWKISVGAGAVLAAIGTVFMVWGFVAVAATRGAGVTGSFGGVVLIVFGLVFGGIGAWMVLRTLRQQGVL